MLRHLDLFSGIGGFALAARMVGGYETVGFCEIESHAKAILRRHWPGVPIYEDVRRLSGSDVGCVVDLVTGGFPCQDISHAGECAGIEGASSGLWREIVRLACELRPPFILVENVAALTVRGLSRVLGDLAESGYDAEWECIPAAAVGAPHIRDRIWVLAHSRQKFGVGFQPWGRFRHLLSEGIDGVKKERREDRELIAMVPGIHPGVAKDWWRTQSRMDRSAHGVPDWMDRIGGLGNAIVPQVAAIFLEAIKRVAA